MRQIVLDTETTGLEVAEGHRIIEIGCVELVNRQLHRPEHLHLKINPQRAIDAGAQAVHGITAEFLVDKPVFAEIAGQFLAFIQGADEVIIHKQPSMFSLDQELQLARFPVFASHVGQVVDSAGFGQPHYPGKRNSLDALCERLEVNNTHRTLHGALLDARLLAEVYIRLTRGQKSLMIEGAQAADAPICAVTQDYSDMMLPVVMPSEAECVAHAAMLEVIDKASSGKTLWKLAVRPDDPA